MISKIGHVFALGSSGLIYNSAQVFMLMQSVGSACQEVSRLANQIGENATKLAQTPNIKGNKWTQISDYLSCFYGNTAAVSLNGAVQLLYEGVKDYYGRFLTFESAVDAIIDTAELDTLAYVMGPKEEELNNISGEVSAIVSKVSKISSQTYTAQEIGNTIGKLIQFLTDVSTNTKDAEASATANITTLNALLDNVEAILKGRENQSAAGFSKTKYLSSPEYGNLSKSFGSVLTQLKTTSESVQNNDTDAKIDGVINEWKERQEKAERTKRFCSYLMTGLAIITTIACPGVGAVVICGIAGGATSIVSEHADQWADVGRAARGKYDVGSILVEGLVGTGKGMLQGYVGSKFAGWSSGKGVIAKMAIGSGEEMVNNVIDDADVLVKEQLKVWVSDDPELKKQHQDALDQQWETVTSLEHWEEVGTKSVTTGVIGTLVGEGFDKIPTGKFTHKALNVGEEIVIGGGKKIAKKAIERGTDAGIEAGFRGENIIEGTVDGFKSITWEDILTWGVQGGAEAGIASAYEQYGGDRFQKNADINDMKNKKGPAGYWQQETGTTEVTSGDGANEYDASTGEYKTSETKSTWVSTADKVEKGRMKGNTKGPIKGIRFKKVEGPKKEEVKLDMTGLNLLKPIVK